MRQELTFCQYADCSTCTEKVKRGFRYTEVKKGEKLDWEIVDTYTLIFLLSGEALISSDEHVNVRFHAGEIALWAMNSHCSWESLEDTASIVLTGDNDLPPCDKKALKRYTNVWLDVDPVFKTLPIRTRVKEFLDSVKNYLEDGISCPYMHKYKQRELSLLFRAYYTPKEIVDFFLPTVCNTHEFEVFVMKNYLRMKGVKEFVDESGMNLSTFNRKFKASFKQTPYQWLIKQKSKHIYHELVATGKNFATIARQFHFSDASHFNRYCKTMYGSTPSKVREDALSVETSNVMQFV